MKITILAIGTRGDVQPLVALGVGLQTAGHEVCMATPAEFEGVVRNSGLGFFLIQANPKTCSEVSLDKRPWKVVAIPCGPSLTLVAW